MIANKMEYNLTRYRLLFLPLQPPPYLPLRVPLFLLFHRLMQDKINKLNLRTVAYEGLRFYYYFYFIIIIPMNESMYCTVAYCAATLITFDIRMTVTHPHPRIIPYIT